MKKCILVLLLLASSSAYAQTQTPGGVAWHGYDQPARLAPLPADPSGFQARLAEAVVQATNARRAQAGLPPLSTDPALAQAARASVTQMRDAQVYGSASALEPLSRRVPLDAARRFGRLGESMWMARGALDWNAETLAGQAVASLSQRANLMEPAFAMAGVATVMAGDQIFVAIALAQPSRTILPATAATFDAPAANPRGPDLQRQVHASPGDLLAALNSERAQQGLSAFHIDNALSRIAQQHSEAMIGHGFIGTTGPDGVPVLDRAIQAAPGWRMAVGIWRGSTGRPFVVRALDSWRQDGRSRTSMLDPRFDQIGIGVAAGGDQAAVTVFYGQAIGDRLTLQRY